MPNPPFGSPGKISFINVPPVTRLQKTADISSAFVAKSSTENEIRVPLHKGGQAVLRQVAG
jgi:hypothetical protein